MFPFMLGLSEAGWGFLGILTAQTFALVALLINARRSSRETSQINRAVNHVRPGSPTLVKRVEQVETKVDWVVDSMSAIATHVGCHLPPSPNQESSSHL
jgi:hypothetical protein